MTTRIIYTAIYGGYDTLRAPRRRPPGYRHVCFTDDPTLSANGWELICRYPQFDDPRMDAKYCKVMAHQLLGEDPKIESLWIDANRIIRAETLGFEYLQNDLGFMLHPSRHCIYREGSHCIRRGLDDPQKIRNALDEYRREGYPENHGLYDGGLIWRRHSAPVIDFNKQWWGAILTGSVRDQISLPVVLWRKRIGFDVMPRRPLKLHIQRHNFNGNRAR